MASFVKYLLLLLLGLGIFIPEFFYQRTAQSKSRKIERIISLSPAETQNLAYLGLENKIIAVSPYDSHPAVQNLPKIAGVNAAEEDIIKLSPDMLSVSESKEFDKLSQKGILVFSSQTGGLKAIYSNLLRLEEIFPEVAPKSQDFLLLWQNMKDAPYRGNFLFVIGIDPVYSVSTNTFLSEFFSLAGWKNSVQTINSYPVLTDEDISKIKTDVIFAPLALVNEKKAIEKVQLQTGAKKIVILTNDKFLQPSPFLLDEVDTLKAY